MWLADLNCKSVCELLHTFTVLISEPQRSSLDVACANTVGDGSHSAFPCLLDAE